MSHRDTHDALKSYVKAVRTEGFDSGASPPL